MQLYKSNLILRGSRFYREGKIQDIFPDPKQQASLIVMSLRCSDLIQSLTYYEGSRRSAVWIGDPFQGCGTLPGAVRGFQNQVRLIKLGINWK